MTAILFSIPLIGIIYEDFKFRAIHWYWLILILAIGFFHFGFHLNQSLINLSFLVVQFLIISLYFSAKEKKWTNIIDKYLGIGDILFLIPLSFFFSPVNFLSFLVFSLVGTLVCIGLVNWITKYNFKTIPLAGFQSIFLMLLTWIGWGMNYSFRWDSLM